MYDDHPTMIELLARQRISERTHAAHADQSTRWGGPSGLARGPRARRRTTLAAALRRAADRLDA